MNLWTGSNHILWSLWGNAAKLGALLRFVYILLWLYRPDNFMQRYLLSAEFNKTLNIPLDKKNIYLYTKHVGSNSTFSTLFRTSEEIRLNVGELQEA